MANRYSTVYIEGYAKLVEETIVPRQADRMKDDDSRVPVNDIFERGNFKLLTKRQRSYRKIDVSLHQT